MSARPASAAEAKRVLKVAVVQARLQFGRSSDDFVARMGKLADRAMKEQPDLVVFPEDIGTPLVGMGGDYEAVVGSRSMKDAVERMVARNAAEVAALCARHKVSPMRALWLLKARAIHAVYSETFTGLAHKHNVTIVAGSVPLVFPDRPADVYNCCCVFAPFEEMQVVARKVNLVDLEKASGLDFSAGSVEGYRAYRAPKGVIGALVCADAWHPKLAQRLAEQGVEILVQVSANPEVWSPGHREGWDKSLFSRAQELGVYGVQCMGVGQLLGLPFQGQSQVVAPKEWTANGSGVLSEARTATEEEVIFATLGLAKGAR